MQAKRHVEESGSERGTHGAEYHVSHSSLLYRKSTTSITDIYRKVTFFDTIKPEECAAVVERFLCMMSTGNGLQEDHLNFLLDMNKSFLRGMHHLYKKLTVCIGNAPQCHEDRRRYDFFRYYTEPGELAMSGDGYMSRSALEKLGTTFASIQIWTPARTILNKLCVGSRNAPYYCNVILEAIRANCR